MFAFEVYANPIVHVPWETTGALAASLQTREVEGVCVVTVDVQAGNALDPEFAAGIDIPLKPARYMANYRHSEFWCRPFFGTDPKDIPDETQALVYQTEDGTFGVILPVVNENYKCVLKGKDSQTVTARLYSNYDKMPDCKGLALVCAQGDTVSELMERCVRVALGELGQGTPPRSQRRYPEIFDYLGWCSWDAMEIQVNHEGLLEKCQEFKDKGIPVRWMILDDMWAEIRDFYNHSYNGRAEENRLQWTSKLYDFEADPRRFPKGLKACIQDMGKYGVKVGMWYPTTGYWRGIARDGAAYAKLKDFLIETENGTLVPDWHEGNAYQYYTAFNRFFRQCGAAFVKIDNQSMAKRFYNRLAPVGRVAREFHAGMEASVGAAFDGALINCMGMASEDIWSRPISAVSRCSDDFQPENRSWFIHHMLQCSYNSLVQGQFYWCDWDMWWTDDGQARKNSLVRAVSGGPIYVSDQIGRSNRELLDPLIASDGKILRCDRPAIPTQDCVCEDPTLSEKGFKLQNTCNGSGIIAVFNLNGENRPAQVSISPQDVDGLAGDTFAVYEHFSQELRILNRQERFTVELKDQDALRLYVLVPYVDGFAAIGRTDKFISPATVAYVCDKKVKLTEPGPYACVRDGVLCLETEEN